jgi:hypothetical protein
MRRFEYQVGQWVYYRDGEETVQIEQKRIHYGNPYYRISTGEIVPEDSLAPALSVDFNY